jgi:hypothetical protein
MGVDLRYCNDVYIHVITAWQIIGLSESFISCILCIGIVSVRNLSIKHNNLSYRIAIFCCITNITCCSLCDFSIHSLKCVVMREGKRNCCEYSFPHNILLVYESQHGDCVHVFVLIIYEV